MDRLKLAESQAKPCSAGYFRHLQRTGLIIAPRFCGEFFIL
jgi:hypothetical protein